MRILKTALLFGVLFSQMAFGELLSPPFTHPSTFERPPLGLRIDSDGRGDCARMYVYNPPHTYWSIERSPDDDDKYGGGANAEGKITIYRYAYQISWGGVPGWGLCYDVVYELKPWEFINAKNYEAWQIRNISRGMRFAGCTFDPVGCALSQMGGEAEYTAWLLTLRDLTRFKNTAWISTLFSGGALAFEKAAQKNQDLANDPPDENYTEIYSYSWLPLNIEWDLPESVNSQINELWNIILWLDQANAGYLASMERVQGALAAGDFEWDYKQLEAMEMFADDADEAAVLLGRRFSLLPEVLAEIGISDFSLDSGQIQANLSNVASEGVPEDILPYLIEVSGNPSIEAIIQANANELLQQWAVEIPTSLFDPIRSVAELYRREENGSESGFVERQLGDLEDKVVGIGPGSSLRDKVALVSSFYAMYDLISACTTMESFVNQVIAISGKDIGRSGTPVDQKLGEELVAEARMIMLAAGCE